MMMTCVFNIRSNGETLIHLLKSSLGTGILAMPHAIALTGYVVGTISTFAIGAIGVYCLHVLVRHKNRYCSAIIHQLTINDSPLTILKNCFFINNTTLHWNTPPACMHYIIHTLLLFLCRIFVSGRNYTGVNNA